MKRILFVLLAAGAGLGTAPAARGQSFLGKPMKTWVAELSSPDAAVRRSAAFALGKIGSAASSEVSGLVGALKDDNAGVRDRAAAALGDIVADFRGGEGALWPDVGPALQKAL